MNRRLAGLAYSACITMQWGCPGPVDPPPAPADLSDDPYCTPQIDSVHVFQPRILPEPDPLGGGLAFTTGFFDDDDQPDLAVGAPYSDAGAGMVLVCWGLDVPGGDDTFELAEDCDAFLSPNSEPNEEFGFALTTLDDPNRDEDWLVVGAPGQGSTSEHGGRVYGFMFDAGRSIVDG